MGLHVAAGDFSKALILLKKQLGVCNFEPLKSIFVDAHTLTCFKAQTMPHLPGDAYQLRLPSQPLPVLTLKTL